MSRSLQDTLSRLPTEVLRDLARAHRIDRGRQAERSLLIETLLSLPDAEGLLAEADRRRLEYLLSRLRPRELRALGERHRVSLRPLAKKRDLVATLAGALEASQILIEVEALAPSERPAGLVLGRDSLGEFSRVEELLVQARRRFEERRFDAALKAAHEASRVAERTTDALRRACWSYAILAAEGLLEPCDPMGAEARGARAVLEKGREALLRAAPVSDDGVLQELVQASEIAHARESERVRDLLAATRDAIREAANLGASIALAEQSWNLGADFLDRGRLRAARESFLEATRRAEDARNHRIQEVEDSVESVSNHIELARNVGAEMDEAEALLTAARAEIAAGEHGRAGDLLKKAERLAMKGQQRQIERAIQLREAQVEKAQSILDACEPVLREAESYDLSVSEVRTLLRQARDVLAKGDYLGGLTFARNTEESTLRLGAQIEQERRRRGIQKPRSEMCGDCRSWHVAYQEDGWARCEDCGHSFRWRGEPGVWERLRGLLTP